MEGETSWVSHCVENFPNPTTGFNSFSELTEESNKEEASGISMDLILPNDLLEKILANLPIASIFRASSVCKRWNEIVTSKRFIFYSSNASPHKPWYFMFTSSDEPVGYAYDPILRKWYNIDLPCIETSNWFIASSYGLVCFMDRDTTSRQLYICNPITRLCKRVDNPPGPNSSDYTALAVYVDRGTREYNISIVKSRQVPDNFVQWDLTVHLYNSKSAAWITLLTENLTGWRGGDESVICDGVLYFLIYPTGGGGPHNQHGVITYDLKKRDPHGLLMRSFVPVPCSLTCGRLMNMRENLLMVGGIGKRDRPDIIKGIGVWTLEGREWREISRMPHKFFQGFGELDDVFASSGSDEVVYIQSYGAPALLVFDVRHKVWKWSGKCPVTKRFPLQLFTGFCFEPRLDVAP
ncbi:hypothetical protein ACP275_02G184400 [Erythranthe tilingii]